MSYDRVAYLSLQLRHVTWLYGSWVRYLFLKKNKELWDNLTNVGLLTIYFFLLLFYFIIILKGSTLTNFLHLDYRLLVNKPTRVSQRHSVQDGTEVHTSPAKCWAVVCR